MFFRRRRSHGVDIWPGFVDAMATLLMVIVFVLMTFVVAQLYLTDAIKGKDDKLFVMDEALITLTNNLKREQVAKEDALSKLKLMNDNLARLDQQLAKLQLAFKDNEDELNHKNDLYDKAQTSITSLSDQIESLNEELQRLNQALATEEEKVLQKDKTLADIRKRMDAALLQKLEELKTLNAQLTQSLENNEKLTDELSNIKKDYKLGLTRYQSDFFAKLSKVLGDRADIHIVGDRFMFQSEVLFDKAAYTVKDEGLTQLKSFAKTLKEITEDIPANVNWVLRVEGHTDKLSIRNARFPSNWELSSARAISVVKALIEEGIPAHRLMAVGFGEFQPLDTGSDEASLARNRRIEFKLDQR